MHLPVLRRLALIDLLVRVDEFLDNYIDVLDGDYGEPRPNRAMSLQQDVQAAIALLERERTA